MLRMFFVTLVSMTLGSAIEAATVNYWLQFLDDSDRRVGTGQLSFDPEVREDLYLYDSFEPDYDPSVDEGYRYCDPAEDLCEFYASWTPIRLSFQIMGGKFDRGSNLEIWLEGSYWYHGRYRFGGYRPGQWEVGDVYFGEFQFYMDPIDPTLDTQSRWFSYFYDYDYINNAVSGRVIVSKVPALPAVLFTLTTIPFLMLAKRRRQT